MKTAKNFYVLTIGMYAMYSRWLAALFNIMLKNFQVYKTMLGRWVADRKQQKSIWGEIVMC